MSLIKALFINMGKVVPYFKMTPELANKLHSNLGKLMLYVKSSGTKLTKKQQDYIMDQTKQLDLYEKSMTPPTPKGPKAEVIDLSKKLPEDAPYSEKNPTGWMPTEKEREGIMASLDINENLVSDTINLLKGKTDPKDMQSELKKIIGRKGTYADYSDDEIKAILNGIEDETKSGIKSLKTAEEIIDEGDFDPSGMKDGGRIKFSQGTNKKMMIVDLLNKGADLDLIKTITEASDQEIMEAIDFFKYGGAEVPLPTFDESGKMIDDGLYKGRETRPEARAYGGRIGYSTGAGVKAYRGIKALMDKVNKRFGKETLKTADDVARPESAINRDLFKKMSDKLKGKAPEKAGQGQFTKAEVIIGRLQNTLNDIKPGDEDYEYVSKTFPNWIKEIQAKPQLADNENVFQRLAVEGLPKNQRLKIYEDGTVDFETLKPTHTFKLKEEIKRKLNASGGLNYLMGL